MTTFTPSWLPNWGRDVLVCGGLAGLALLLGLTVNRFRASPLPARYATKQARLQTEVSALATAPTEKREIQYLLPDALATLLARDALTVLDARPEVFYGQGHLPGALPLPRADFRRYYEQHRAALEKNKARLLVIYCQGGECEDSELVAAALSQLGFTNLAILAGGWEAWQAHAGQ